MWKPWELEKPAPAVSGIEVRLTRDGASILLRCAARNWTISRTQKLIQIFSSGG